MKLSLTDLHVLVNKSLYYERFYRRRDLYRSSIKHYTTKYLYNYIATFLNCFKY